MIFKFNAQKNELLFQTRGVSFPQIIETIEKEGILLDFAHPNQEKYPNQMIMVVKWNDYTYCVPYVINEDEIFLKTIFPNRNFLYLLKEDKDD